MKLQHILVACFGMLVCASCSKDKQSGSIDSLPDAKITIQVGASKAISKAADPETLPGEVNINNVAVLLFDETGTTLLGTPVWQQITTTNGSATITDVPAKATKARIILLANTPEGAFQDVANYDDFQARLAQLSDQLQTHLTMSSQVIVTTRPLEEGDNYLGYASMGNANINGISSPVEITRLAARLDLVSLGTRFAGSLLEGRTVRVNQVYIANQKTASHYFSAAYWGVVMAGGNLENSSVTNLNLQISDDVSVLNTPYRHYVMENDGSEQATQLVVQATLEAGGGYAEEAKWFTATINPNGLTQGYDHNFVKRNYIYRLFVTFGPNSFRGDEPEPTPPDPPVPPIPPTPDSTTLDVKVEVVGWGPFNQHVEIE